MFNEMGNGEWGMGNDCAGRLKSTHCSTFLLRLPPSAFRLFACLPFLLVGCTDRGATTTDVASSEAADQAQRIEVGRRLFDSSIDMLSRSDEFDEGSTDAAISLIVQRINESLAVLSEDKSIVEPLTLEDGKVLREIVWLRDAARAAVGKETDNLVRAEKLFDWVVRNTQQIPDDAKPADAPPQLPWHVLLFGRGTALDQAWLFQLLARQQGLDVVLLAYEDTQANAAPHWWCAALLHENELYLFDPHVGLPIAGPDGKRPATLNQAAADDKLLRALDLSDGKPYAPRAADLQKVVALCEASAPYVAPRFARLGRELSGEERRLELAVDEKALLERVGRCSHVSSARPWPLRDLRYTATRETAVFDALKQQLQPFRLPERGMLAGNRYIAPPLWKARVRHLSGKYADDASQRITISRLYQEARPADEDLDKLQINSQNWEGMLRMKQHATYWLGLTAFDLKNYDAAAMYFETVLKEPVNGGWTAGARYNLGRTQEAAGKRDDALKTYRTTYLNLPPDVVCLERAQRLERPKSP